MLDLKDFIMKMLKGMIGHEMDYKIREITLDYLNKTILLEEDVAEIDALLIERQQKLEQQRVEAERIENELKNLEVPVLG